MKLNDIVFQLDILAEYLEEEGADFETIIEAMRAYVSIVDPEDWL